MSLRFIAVLALFIASAGLFSSIEPASAATKTCFGRAATVARDGDTYYLTAGDDVVVGTNGADTVSDLEPGANGGTDYICTGGGNDDVLLLGASFATIDTGSGSDYVSAQTSGTIDLNLGTGNDFANIFNRAGMVRGGTGNDVLFFQGHDIIAGTVVDSGSGNDLIQSAAGDFLYSGSGTDTIIDQSDSGSSLVDCGSGRDTFYAPVAVTIRSCENPY